jgi:hypothetical protein
MTITVRRSRSRFPSANVDKQITEGECGKRGRVGGRKTKAGDLTQGRKKSGDCMIQSDLIKVQRGHSRLLMLLR